MDVSPSIQRNVLLRQERVRRNWRQQDLADHIGTTVATVKRWERGRQQPSAYFRVKLCTLFGTSAEALGLVEGDAPQPASAHPEVPEAVPARSSPSEALALWTVPYLRNPHFTGRDESLDQLAHHLSQDGQAERTTTRRVALTQPQAIKGLGGIGKTQIAVEYAYRSLEQGHYTHTLWVHAENEETITMSFARFAELFPFFEEKEEKNQQKLVTAIKRWLEQCQQRWLLIFDNADDLSLVQEYFPRQGNGSLLLTTRANAVTAIAASIEVEKMGLIEGTQLLLHRANRLPATDEEYNEASNVVIALDGFPLALDQAGAYIEETGCSFRDYLQLYQDHHKTLLARRGMEVCDYPNSVATTWSLSFQKITQTNSAAAELLQLCTFLAPERIPEELLQDGAPHWPSILQQAVSDLFTFNQMLNDLLVFSLVKRREKDQMLSIHRLVQVVQMDTMETEEQRQWAERVVRAVNTLFPHDPKEEIETWPQCLRYLDQVQMCDLLIQQHAFVFPEAADLLNRAGLYLRERASYTLAEPLFQRALRIWEQQLGPEHSQVAYPLNNLALLYKNQGKYGEAESLFQRALHIWEQQLGPEHSQVASPLYNLALLYYEQGKYEEAEPLFQRALRIWEQQLGPEHSQVAYPLNGLANLYYQEGKYEEAEPLYQRALRIWQQQWGPDHPKAAYPLHNLAILYKNQGKYEEAEPLYQRALRIWEQQLGPEHPLVAHPLTGLADLCRMQSKYAEAEALYERGLRIRAQLEPTHPDTAETLHGMAALKEAQGRYQEAALFYQRTLSIQEGSLGSYHQKTVETRTRYLTLLQAMV